MGQVGEGMPHPEAEKIILLKNFVENFRMKFGANEQKIILLLWKKNQQISAFLRELQISFGDSQFDLQLKLWILDKKPENL